VPIEPTEPVTVEPLKLEEEPLRLEEESEEEKADVEEKVKQAPRGRASYANAHPTPPQLKPGPADLRLSLLSRLATTW